MHAIDVRGGVWARRATLLLLVIVLCGATYVLGYRAAEQARNAVEGELAFASISDQVDALRFLAKGDTESATKMLKLAIDGALLRGAADTTPFLDDRGIGRKKEVILAYSRMRAIGPEVDYGDSGQTSARVQQIIDRVLQ